MQRELRNYIRLQSAYRSDQRQTVQRLRFELAELLGLVPLGFNAGSTLEI